jgi:hypothetical protein
MFTLQNSKELFFSILEPSKPQNNGTGGSSGAANFRKISSDTGSIIYFPKIRQNTPISIVGSSQCVVKALLKINCMYHPDIRQP